VKRSVSVAALLASLFLARGAESACNVSAGGINFGPYDAAAAAPRDSMGSVTVSCDRNPPTDVTVTIGPGGSSGGFNPRTMRNSSGTDRLTYNLYTDASRNVVWGDGTAGTAAVNLRKVNKNRPVTATIYARIPSGQDVVPGTYLDTLVVTILY
jgi:spore coat protein U-like protein